MLLVSSCSCIDPIRWSQVLSWEWRFSWSSADRRCSNYIWVINNLIAYQSASYIRDLTVICDVLIYACYIYLLLATKSSNTLWPSCITLHSHYNGVITGAMESQITSLMIIYLTVYSGTDQRKHLRHWLLWGEFTGDRWIPRTNGQ